MDLWAEFFGLRSVVILFKLMQTCLPFKELVFTLYIWSFWHKAHFDSTKSTFGGAMAPSRHRSCQELPGIR